MMLNKNLRSILYYVVTVSVLCLMIEVTKRVPDPRTSLSPKFYEVVTAKQSELATLPKSPEFRREEEGDSTSSSLEMTSRLKSGYIFGHLAQGLCFDTATLQAHLSVSVIMGN